MINVLFLCTGNSSRSQIAEGIINHHFKGSIQAKSAGVSSTKLSQFAVKVMREIGIDISHHTTNTPEDFKDEQFDYIITLCDSAREACPVFWTKGEAMHLHFGFENPENFHGTDEEKLKLYRDLRDKIEAKLLKFFDRELKNKKEQLKRLKM